MCWKTKKQLVRRYNVTASKKLKGFYHNLVKLILGKRQRKLAIPFANTFVDFKDLIIKRKLEKAQGRLSELQSGFVPTIVTHWSNETAKLFYLTYL